MSKTQLLIWCFIVLFVGNSKILFAQKTPVVKDVSCTDFSVLMDTCQSYILLDVRLMEAFKKECIPGAVSVANKNLLLSVMDTVDFETPVLIYCEEGFRSQRAAEMLKEKGFLSVFNLEDGYWKWKRKGFPVVEMAQ